MRNIILAAYTRIVWMFLIIFRHIVGLHLQLSKDAQKRKTI